MLDIKHEELYCLKSQIMSETFKILIRHAGGSYEDLKVKDKYIVLYNMLNMGVDNALKEVDDIWTD